MKKIVNKGLYVEGLRQTATLTAVFTVVLIFFLAATLTSNVTYDTTVTKEAQTLAGWFAAAVVTAAPALTFKLFSFLSSRSKSDFYHSVPHKRTTVYFSYFLALATQFFVMLASASAAVIVIFRMFRGRLYLTAPVPGILARWAGEAAGVRGTFGGYGLCPVAPVILIMALGFFAAALLCCGAALIARSASGTAFNSVVLYAAILFVPRILVSLYAEAVTSTVPNAAYVDFLENVRLNIPVGSIVNIVRTPFAVPSLEFYPILYTAVVAVLYIAAGALIFCRKKSESAADPAPSKALRFIYSVLVFCSGSFFVTVTLTENLLLRSYNRGGDLTPSMYFTFYGIALIAFLIYVIVTTKKWSGILRALPALGVGILLNGLLALSLCCVVTSEVNFSPEQEQVQWISYYSPSRKDDYGSYFSMSLNDYTLLDGEKYRITDEEVIKAVCGELSEFVDRYKSGESLAAFGKRQKRFVIKTKTGKKTRVVYLSDSDTAKIEAALLKDENFRKDLTTLPDFDPRALEIMNAVISGTLPFSADIADSLKEEMKTVDPQALFEANKKYVNTSTWTLSVGIRTGSEESGGAYLQIPVTPELFPKTYELITGKLPAPSAYAQTFDDFIYNYKEEYEDNGIYDTEMSVKCPNGKYVMNAGSKIKDVITVVERLCPGRYAPKDVWYTLCIVIKDNDENTPDMRFEFCIETTLTAQLEQSLQSLGFVFTPNRPE